MSKLALLKGATDLSDVARILAFKPSSLSYLLYKLPVLLKYTEFDIPKRHGGSRKISAPIDSLKVLQQHLSNLLQDCLEELEQAGLRKNPNQLDGLLGAFVPCAVAHAHFGAFGTSKKQSN